MGIEIPGISAVVAHLPDAERQLAAFGGIVFPLALLIESPIIMILAASTAMSRDLPSFLRLRRFMTQLAMGLTLIHMAVAFTPLYDLIAVRIIGAPDTIIEPARTGLQVLSLWTWAIGDRRFHQGLLIRFGRQRTVSIGTMLRLVGTGIPLLVAFGLQRGFDSGVIGSTLRGLDLAFARDLSAAIAWADTAAIHGTMLAGIAMTCGVFVEATYTRICAAEVRRGPLANAPLVSTDEERRLGAILGFYVPLAMTPLLALATQPIGSAGMGRMPLTKISMAAWPMINGLGFMIRSVGVAYNEVVVRHAGEPGGERALRRFATIGATGTLIAHATLAFTPLGSWLFRGPGGLSPEIAAVALEGFRWATPLPVVSWTLSLYTGLLVHARRTRGVTESVAIFLTVTSLTLVAGSWADVMTGASVAVIAINLGAAAQCTWLVLRWRRVRAEREAANAANAATVAVSTSPNGPAT